MTYAKMALPQRGLLAVLLTGTLLFAASCSERSATLGPSLSVVAVPDTIIITPENDTINSLGDSLFLTAVVYDEADNVLADPVTWTSSNPLRATVADGWVKAVGRGKVNIYARSGTARTFARVLVRQVVDSIALTPATPTLQVGDTFRLSLYAADSSGTLVEGGTISWLSSNDAVATVDNTGLVTAISGGSVNVSARLTGPGIVSPLRVRTRVTSVYPENSLVISPPLDTLRAIGYTRQFTTNSLTINGNPLSVIFKSLNPNIATVDSLTGLATAIRRGTAKITAKAGAFADTADLVIVQVVATVTTSPDSVNLAVGDTTTLVGVPFDSGGTPISAVLAWASADTTIATVSPEGLVTAIGEGTVNIIGSRLGASDTSVVTVSAPDATTHLWAAGVAGDWTDATKWSPDLVPAETDSAQIPLTGSAVSLTAATTIARLTMATGTSLAMGAHDFTIVTDVLVDAGASIVSGGGRLLLTGIGAMQGTIPNATITGARSLAQSTTITGALTIQDGSLTISDQALTIQQP